MPRLLWFLYARVDDRTDLCTKWMVKLTEIWTDTSCHDKASVTITVCYKVHYERRISHGTGPTDLFCHSLDKHLLSASFLYFLLLTACLILLNASETFLKFYNQICHIINRFLNSKLLQSLPANYKHPFFSHVFLFDLRFYSPVTTEVEVLTCTRWTKIR